MCEDLCPTVVVSPQSAAKHHTAAPSLPVPSFLFFCYIPFHYYYYYYYYYYISLLLLLVLYFTLVIKLFLSQPTSSAFFPDSPPHPTGSGVGGEGKNPVMHNALAHHRLTNASAAIRAS